jgi:alpha-1,3-mannosyltransferase
MQVYIDWEYCLWVDGFLTTDTTHMRFSLSLSLSLSLALSFLSLVQKFLPEDIFVSKPLSILLLICHVGTLIYFAYQWIQSISGTRQQQQQQQRRPIFFIHSHPSTVTTSSTSQQQQQEQRPWLTVRLSPIYITSTMFTANFIGIVFARTLHYQFYSWYYHAIPFLLFSNDIYNYYTDSKNNNDDDDENKNSTTTTTISRTAYWTYPLVIRIGIIVSIEMAFLTFPATPYSSLMLQISHLLILLQIRPPPYHLFLSDNNNNNNDRNIDETNETTAAKSTIKKVN